MCKQCEAAHNQHRRNVEATVTWRPGDRVSIKSTGESGIVAYIYTNGYTLVDLGQPVNGGLLNNDSAFGNADIIAEAQGDA